MGRIMAIDFGTKRCGIAITDEQRIIATPLTTIPASELVDFIQKYCEKNNLDIIVFGKPVDMLGKPSESEKQMIPYINRLKKLMPQIAIERWDERFTSKMALQAMIDAGSKKSERREKGNIDKISATIILQDYMNYKKS